MKIVLCLVLGAGVVAPCLAGDAPHRYRPSKAVTDGNELAFIYIGGNGCAPCKAPGMRDAVIRARDLLAARAAAEHRPFSATGVALDFDIESGLEFLRAFGDFDQIIVGRSWYNDAALRFMTGDRDAIVAIPQVIVYERELRIEGSTLSASPPKILARIPGTGIPLWVDAGVKLRGD